MLNGLTVSQPAVDEHDKPGTDKDENQSAFTNLTRIADDFLSANESDDSEDDQDAAEPEEGVLPPDGSRNFLGHSGAKDTRDSLSLDVQDPALWFNEIKKLLSGRLL